MTNKRLGYILTPDAQKLVDAGFINPCDGSLTVAGRTALWLIVMKSFNKDFIASADEVIAEKQASK